MHLELTTIYTTSYWAKQKENVAIQKPWPWPIMTRMICNEERIAVHWCALYTSLEFALAAVLCPPTNGYTWPATTPTQAPTLVTLPFKTRSKTNQVSMEEAEATKVVATARAATPSVVDKAEPPLNPNQPNQRRQPPKITKGTLAGPTSFSTCLRGPRIAPATKPDTPELMWTTVPPAKSRAPISAIQPPAPQTQWHKGA